MTENEYKELVLADFDRKLATNGLRPELVSPSRRSLKAHCINTCTERFDPKDELLLQSFFGVKENQGAYLKAIGNANADMFRALHTFLNERKVNTAFNNICLLAWMIDFEPRPYRPDLKIPSQSDKEPGTSTLAKSKSSEKTTDKSAQKGNTSPSQGKKKIIVLALSFGGIMLLSIYLIMIFRAPTFTGQERCMIWYDDHYEPVNCNEKLIRGRTYPIDHGLIGSFKKITRPDTLTLYSVRKVWYINTKGRVEFYTASGHYPLDTTRRLLPMTDHILKKYVYHLPD
jgi:hypothetical protein